jgi:hypothetical protein
MRSVWRHGQPLVDDPARLDGVTALGMDETAFLRANRHPTPRTEMTDPVSADPSSRGSQGTNDDRPGGAVIYYQ